MSDIRPARRADAPAIADTLASAFGEDPMFRWALARDGDIEHRLRPFFLVIAKNNLRHDDHLVFCNEDQTGAAVWRDIDKWKMPPMDLVRSAPAILRMLGRRVAVFAQVLNQIEKQHPTEPHYYLEMLGTNAAVQGKGVGSTMISHQLQRCDEEGVPAYLESSNPQNVPFYARHGFVERERLQPGKDPDAPYFTTMWREPR